VDIFYEDNFKNLNFSIMICHAERSEASE